MKYGRNLTRLLLIIFLSLSLVMMGCLFWAVILDNDPGTFTDIGIYLDGDLGNGGDPALDEDGVIPVVGGTLVKGNGDQDDNKEEAFLLLVNCGLMVESSEGDSFFTCSERRLVLAYVDFGYLKVMPTDGGFYMDNCILLSGKGLSAA